VATEIIILIKLISQRNVIRQKTLMHTAQRSSKCGKLRKNAGHVKISPEKNLRIILVFPANSCIDYSVERLITDAAIEKTANRVQ
jgi:hypothetical protein